jgi:hypothetical protein
MKITDAELAELLAGITPGPWKVGDGYPPFHAWQGQIIGDSPDGEFILASCNHNYPDEGVRNAQAIARVPDILADLIAAREALRRIAGHNFEDTGNWKDDARMFQNIAMEALE